MGDYAKALGGKLRAIRQQQGLSLHGVEQKSGGRWKAVVVGSYERGDRAVTVQKLAELADFYGGVPVAELLPEGRIPSAPNPPPRSSSTSNASSNSPPTRWDRWPATPPPSRASAATTTARSSPSAPRTSGHCRSSTT